jgi:hypothetical protein
MITKMFTLFGLAAMLSAALTLPTATATPNTNQVHVLLSHQDDCNGSATLMVIDADKCYDFAPGIKSLRVIHHDDSIRYNARTYSSLSSFFFYLGNKREKNTHDKTEIRLTRIDTQTIVNVYSALNCESGPVLQPVLSDACSAVVAYKAIKLSVGTPRD